MQTICCSLSQLCPKKSRIAEQLCATVMLCLETRRQAGYNCTALCSSAPPPSIHRLRPLIVACKAFKRRMAVQSLCRAWGCCMLWHAAEFLSAVWSLQRPAQPKGLRCMSGHHKS